MTINKRYLRRKILANLRKYGIQWNTAEGKISVADFRETQAKLAQHTNPSGAIYAEKLAKYIAKPDDIDILKVKPYLVPVNPSEEHHRIWAYATSHWSIPVTTGYGRRIRYFVFDAQNGKLLGIVGLTDPVIGLEAVGHYVHWVVRGTEVAATLQLHDGVRTRRYSSLQSYTWRKLVALTVMFPEVRSLFYEKYKASKSIIGKKQKKPYLVYVDTLGAFGKSSIYNRLLNWDFIGYTKGQSHIHITANGSWEYIKKAVPAKEFKTYKFGQGPNWKMRILRIGLHNLGLSEEMMSIGWQRGYYRCALAENWQEYLRGEDNRINWKNNDKDDLIDYWNTRWVAPRLDQLQANLVNPAYGRPIG